MRLDRQAPPGLPTWSCAVIQPKPCHATHLPAGCALGQEIAQQRGGVARPAIVKQQQQRPQRQASAQQTVQVCLAQRQQRLAVQPRARARVCKRKGRGHFSAAGGTGAARRGPREKASPPGAPGAPPRGGAAN